MTTLAAAGFVALLMGASAQATTPADPKPLNLRLPPQPARLVPTAAAQPRTVRLEARKTFIEWGVEGSREALIACQRGAYPGATVASSGVLVAGGEGQPDHCYRF